MPYSKEWKDLPDEAILRLSQKEPDAFEELVVRYEAAFLRKAKAILYAKEDAEEVVQDAFSPQEGASFSSWAYAILVRLCYTRYGKMKKARERMQSLEPEAYERLPGTDDFLEDLSIRSEVLAALSKLPVTAARVLRLQFIEGKTQDEIARIEGSSIPAVKTRVHRAKKLFKQAYDEQH